MNQINMNQLLTELSLYSEFIACLVAASAFSLFTGWMLHRTSAKKRMDAASKNWKRQIRKLEESAIADTDNLEEKLQDLAGEVRTLKATNRVLTESLKKNDATIQKARAEAIELNRQNAETQERLQRVIQRKGGEFVYSRTTSDLKANESHKPGGSTYTPTIIASTSSTFLGVAFDEDLNEEFEETLPQTIDTGLRNKLTDHDETALNDADTIAFNTPELFDATLQMSAEEFIHQNRQLPLPSESEADDFIDETADVSDVYFDDYEESTVALDDETLAYARKPVSNVD